MNAVKYCMHQFIFYIKYSIAYLITIIMEDNLTTDFVQSNQINLMLKCFSVILSSGC